MLKDVLSLDISSLTIYLIKSKILELKETKHFAVKC